MGKKEKLIFSLFSRPRNFKWEDLVALLKGYGFEVISNSGSRYKFRHPGAKRILCFHKPHPGNTVKLYVVDQTIELLGELGITP